ncbi:hypothetical protein ABZ477_11285 [Microbacterium sp. NPDC019599]|uniref:LolA family protein n=1 Tax=Microbacterium sp. NPDC019599 TaxID=3154690 RepID=UPI0033E4AC4D
MAMRVGAPRRARIGVLLAALGASAAAVAAAVLAPLQAGAAVDLPDKTPEELIAFVHASDIDALSGTIEQTSELGLPDLGALLGSTPDRDRGSEAGAPADLEDLIDLATGTHTANVFLDGESARLQVLDRLAERNVYVDGAAREAWFVDSETQTATHVTVTGESGDPKHEAGVTTPEDVVDDAFAKLDETTEVSVGTDALVAGREVYELVLTPRTDDTLVGEVRFAIDGENGVPLAASITARGAEAPAFRVAFTDVDFSAPDPSVFEFVPGAGITVAEEEIALPLDRPDGVDHGDHAEPVVHGEGWSAVVELPPGEHGGQASAEASAALQAATTPVEGGRVLQTSLVTIMFTDDGRVLAGAVPAEHLVEVAQAGR